MSQPSPQTTDSAKPRRRLQFSLRTMIFLVAGACAVFALVAGYREYQLRQLVGQLGDRTDWTDGVVLYDLIGMSGPQADAYLAQFADESVRRCWIPKYEVFFFLNRRKVTFQDENSSTSYNQPPEPGDRSETSLSYVRRKGGEFMDGRQNFPEKMRWRQITQIDAETVELQYYLDDAVAEQATVETGRLWKTPVEIEKLIAYIDHFPKKRRQGPLTSISGVDNVELTCLQWLLDQPGTTSVPLPRDQGTTDTPESRDAP